MVRSIIGYASWTESWPRITDVIAECVTLLTTSSTSSRYAGSTGSRAAAWQRPERAHALHRDARLLAVGGQRGTHERFEHPGVALPHLPGAAAQREQLLGRGRSGAPRRRRDEELAVQPCGDRSRDEPVTQSRSTGRSCRSRRRCAPTPSGAGPSRSRRCCSSSSTHSITRIRRASCERCNRDGVAAAGLFHKLFRGASRVAQFRIEKNQNVVAVPIIVMI